MLVHMKNGFLRVIYSFLLSLTIVSCDSKNEQVIDTWAQVLSLEGWPNLDGVQFYPGDSIFFRKDGVDVGQYRFCLLSKYGEVLASGDIRVAQLTGDEMLFKCDADMLGFHNLLLIKGEGVDVRYLVVNVEIIERRG